VINTGYNDQHAAIAKDSLSLYFTSNRHGGYGADYPLGFATRERDDSWGSRMNPADTVIQQRAVAFAPAFPRDGIGYFFK